MKDVFRPLTKGINTWLIDFINNLSHYEVSAQRFPSDYMVVFLTNSKQCDIIR